MPKKNPQRICRVQKRRRKTNTKNKRYGNRKQMQPWHQKVKGSVARNYTNVPQCYLETIRLCLWFGELHWGICLESRNIGHSCHSRGRTAGHWNDTLPTIQRIRMIYIYLLMLSIILL